MTTTKHDLRRLGAVQKDVYRCLCEHGWWSQWAGWYWDSVSGTERTCQRLVKRGLVAVSRDMDFPNVTIMRYRPVYVPALIKELSPRIANDIEWGEWTEVPQ